MGKAERAAARRTKRGTLSKQKTVMVSEQQIYDKFIQMYHNELDEHWKLNAPAWLKRDLWSLHVNHGWGKKRLNRYLANKIEEFNCIEDKLISDEDIDIELEKIGVIVKL